MNFDDMAGPGKNYYLWYSLDTKRFTVVTADLNLTFNGSATAGPYDNMTMGGSRAAGQQAGGDGQMPEGGFPGMPEGGFPGMPEGGQMPEGGFPGMPEGNDDEGDRGQRGGMFGGNALKERFLAAEAFHEVYEKAYRELYQELFASGAATRSLTAISGVLGTLDSADRATVDSEVATLRTSIETRTKSLATNEVITGKA
ncbi:MAG: CotH kinase family protein, partial [Micromonosporaceae bacterium]|nr:CotH kinase family protein [Micromonosporaceae bacterium]